MSTKTNHNELRKTMGRKYKLRLLFCFIVCFSKSRCFADKVFFTQCDCAKSEEERFEIVKRGDFTLNQFVDESVNSAVECIPK